MKDGRTSSETARFCGSGRVRTSGQCWFPRREQSPCPTQGQRVVDAARADPTSWSLALAREPTGSTFSDMDGELASYVAPELHEELTGFSLLCAKPIVGGTPYGVQISEDEMLELYAEVACAWDGPDTH